MLPSKLVWLILPGKPRPLSPERQPNYMWVIFSSVYFIYAGTFKEQVVISRANIKIYGQTSNATTYTSNTVTITNNIPASSAGSNDASG
jgi:hypothetical protein